MATVEVEDRIAAPLEKVWASDLVRGIDRARIAGIKKTLQAGGA